MSEDQKPRKQFTPGTIVRVRGQLMGVGQASLRGLLDEAEDINDITQAERIAAREGVALEAAEPEKGQEPVELTSGQKAAATRAANKAKREAVIKAGNHPADVDAEAADEESKLGETTKPVEEPGTISDGEPPAPTDEADTGRSQADGSADPTAEAPELSDKATDAEVEQATGETEAENAKVDAESAALADADVPTAVTEEPKPSDG